MTLEYPAAIHDETQDLPFAPERLTPKSEWLSDMQHAQRKLAYAQENTYHGTAKLLLTQFHKCNYVVHFKILQFYLKHGMRISKLHRGVKYVQAAFFEPYVSFNSRERQATNDKLLQDFYKLKNNSLYGKTMENLRGRRNFKLLNDEDQRLCSRNNFIKSIMFTPNLVGVSLDKIEVKLNKPVYIGQCVLDNSKLVMYQLRYERLITYEQEFACEIKVIGGDMDSFFLLCNCVSLTS